MCEPSTVKRLEVTYDMNAFQFHRILCPVSITVQFTFEKYDAKLTIFTFENMVMWQNCSILGRNLPQIQHNDTTGFTLS